MDARTGNPDNASKMILFFDLHMCIKKGRKRLNVTYLVPVRFLVSWLLRTHADSIFSPGANISTNGPQLLKVERESSLPTDPTVMASGAEAGE